MKRLLILAVCLVALAPPALAQSAARVEAANKAALRPPAAGGYVHAVQVYPFADGALYGLLTAPERISDIMLQPGETLISVAAGDTARWTIGDTTSGSGEGKRTHILVKPFRAGLATNLVIATDRRVYRLQLSSAGRGAMAAIAWRYPHDELVAIERSRRAAETARAVSAGIAVADLDFNYRIGGDRAAWRPLRVFDDGRQTWIQFSPSIAVGEAPPLFVIGQNGEAGLVNYRVSGNYYVVDRLFEAAELRLGGKKQKIVRIERSRARNKRKGI